jgi:Ras-related protein Rab-2A
MMGDDTISSFRYIIIGDTEVGKSSLLLQFTEKQFNFEHDMTIGVEMGSRQVTLGSKKVKLEIWDTAGQESYLSITRSYYRGADGCLLVFDITNRKSFESLSMWLSEAKQNSNNPNLVILMIGNKADLQDSRQVSSQEAMDFAVANQLTYLEITAKSYDDVERAFTSTAQMIEKRTKEKGRAQNNGIVLNGTSRTTKNTKQVPGSRKKSNSPDCC